MPSGDDGPLRQGAGEGLDWFSVATEASGGGTSDLGYFLEVSVFIGIFGVGLMSRRCPRRPRGRTTRLGGAPTLVDAPGLSWPNSFTSGASFLPQKIIKNWHVNWTPFGILFL